MVHQKIPDVIEFLRDRHDECYANVLISIGILNGLNVIPLFVEWKSVAISSLFCWSKVSEWLHHAISILFIKDDRSAERSVNNGCSLSINPSQEGGPDNAMSESAAMESHAGVRLEKFLNGVFLYCMEG